MAPPSAATEPQTATEDRILDAATKLFANKGYQATTVGDIVAAAGANRAAIGYHFGGKEELYLLVLKRAYTELCSGEVYTKPYPPGMTAEARLRDYLREFVRQVVEAPDPAAMQLMMREMFQPSTPACEAWVEQFIRPKADYLNGLLRELLPSASAETIWHVQFSIVGQCLFYRQNRWVIERMVGPGCDVYHAERMVEHVTRFTLGGVAAVAAGGEPFAARRCPSEPVPAGPPGQES